MKILNRICRFSQRWAIPVAIALIASACAVPAGAGGDTQTGLPGAIPWHHAHPILVNFTAGLVPVSFVCDLLGKAGKRESLASAGWWTILFSALLTPLTAVSGYFWRAEIPAEVLPADLINTHQYLGIGIAAALVALATWRGLAFSAGRRAGTIYLVAAAAVVASLAYQGNIGGTLVFG